MQVTEAAKQLEQSKMARFDERSGNLYVTELGRVASHFYIRHASIVVFNEALRRNMNEAEVGDATCALLHATHVSQVLVEVRYAWWLSRPAQGQLDISQRHPCSA